MPEPEPEPLYYEYLHERNEVEVETIKTLESEPVMENPDNLGDPAPESEEDETPEEFRTQLQSVQKQLEALSSLPITIQATIAALTEQLAVLAQPKRKSKSVTPRPEAGSTATVQADAAASSGEVVPEVSETFEVSEYSKTEAVAAESEQSASSDEGEHIIYTDEQLEKLQEKMREHDIEWTDRNDKKPKYQTEEWAIVAHRFYMVLQEEEEVEYVTLPLRISQAVYSGEEQDATSTLCQQISTQPTQDTIPTTIEVQ